MDQRWECENGQLVFTQVGLVRVEAHGIFLGSEDDLFRILYFLKEPIDATDVPFGKIVVVAKGYIVNLTDLLFKILFEVVDSCDRCDEQYIPVWA